MDGYALGRELRVLLGDASPTLIALTGYGQPRDQRRTEEAGFSMHLVKPIQAETLMDILAARAPDGGRTTGRPTGRTELSLGAARRSDGPRRAGRGRGPRSRARHRDGRKRRCRVDRRE